MRAACGTESGTEIPAEDVVSGFGMFICQSLVEINRKVLIYMALRTKSWTGRKEGIMYTREQKEKALAMYDATQSIAEVIRRLGYPSKQALYTWIANRDKPWQKPNGFRGVNTAEHPRHPSVNLKISAIRACFEEGNDVQFISAQIGYSRASIYAWHRRYLKEGMLGLMNTKD